MGKSAVDRAVPSGGTLEKIGVVTFDDIVEQLTGANAIKGEQFSLYGHPARFVKIASQSSAVNGTEFPNDGSAVAQSGSTSTITLAADAPSIDLTGLLVLTISGTGANQCRRITAYNTGTKQATVSPNWTAPDNTTNYRVLIDCFRLAELHVKAEFQNAAATAPDMQLMAMLYDYPDTSGGLFTRAPFRFPDYTNIVENLDVVTDSAESTYRMGRTRTTSVRGALGAKVRVISKPAAGNYSIWACAT